jgi:RHS repeat-associated protein
LRSNDTDELVSAEYRYDCFNRRIASIIDLDGDGTADETPHFVYGGQAAWQLFEEYNGPDSTATRLRSYVYGNYIDEVLQVRDHPSGEDFYYHQDDLFSVYAITDDTGAVAERYEYGDYGQVTILDANNSDRDLDMDGNTESLYGNRHTFTGRLLDEELTLDDGSRVLQYRNRYSLPSLGRFLQRDPLHYIDGMNVYTCATSNSTSKNDPHGTQSGYLTPYLPQYPGDQFPIDIAPEEYISPSRFRWHGNWGGPKWQCGMWMEDHQTIFPPDHPFYAPPVDAEDGCYEKHDRDAFECRQKELSYDRCACTHRADLRLVKCLKSLPNPSNPVRRDWAAFIFRLKTMTPCVRDS